ncbi:hypothetical protein HanXRQr2_Chr14g0643781 [Helianthus annuus]|uniref:Uncharacterized protein n=1 Tax=Helianthus annuus TaxID=4232 RepID=A0A9K3E8T0_HELAN|nr:hypothetical protein HanXRQr2_Chr14g0643781 [Helianthus annuus]KAJ0840350.1 hypothetical protein HanPSC8_Chr14g0617661 [Helianthus annuus]
MGLLANSSEEYGAASKVSRWTKSKDMRTVITAERNSPARHDVVVDGGAGELGGTERVDSAIGGV